MISYAQNFEDVMLNRVFGNRKDGFYIDVGAMDPTADSVTKHFYDRGWHGINVEPNRTFYERLKTERPRDTNLNVAVGAEDTTNIFYVFGETGNSTVDPAVRDRLMSEGQEPEEQHVTTTTLAAICNEHVSQPIDFLKIDCEGWEKNVIEGADWDRFRPIIVVVEATQPNSTEPAWSDWEHLLTAGERYEIVYFDGLNRYYLRHDCGELRRHFEIPPNVFDSFTLRAGHYLAAEAYQQCGAEISLRDQTVEQLRSELRKSIEAAQALDAQRENLLAEYRRLQLEEEALRNKTRALDAAMRVLEERLDTSRLWIGQLSQDLAACRQAR